MLRSLSLRLPPPLKLLPPPIDPAVPEPMDEMSDRSSAARAAVPPPSNAFSDKPVSDPFELKFEPPADVNAAKAAVAPPVPLVFAVDDWTEVAAGDGVVLWLVVSPRRLPYSVLDVPLVTTRSLSTRVIFFGWAAAASGGSIVADPFIRKKGGGEIGE